MESEEASLHPNFVFMPNDPKNILTRVHNKIRSREIRYEVIQHSLNNLKSQLADIKHEEEHVIFCYLQKCILIYNPKLSSGNFNLLEELCFFMAEEPCEKFCLIDLLSGIIDMALELPHLFPQPIKLLRSNCPDFIEMTKHQCACILANAFFCTFPKRDLSRSNTGYFGNYPRINFNELYDDTHNTSNPHSWRGRARSAKLEKLKCLMNYFKRRIALHEDDGDTSRTLLFGRKVLNPQNFIQWEHCDLPLLSLKAYSTGTIESADERLQVDFANKFVGGGTLGNGSAQEELRFVTCPELIVSQLFTECLEDNEALVVQGFEQFSSYTGYGSTFHFKGDHEEEGRYVKQLVALDALQFPGDAPQLQFTKESITRELTKCLAGFKRETDNNFNISPFDDFQAISSGKWGCGVFNGNAELKSLIQWMATSVCNKSLELYTFGDKSLTHSVNELAKLATKQNCTVEFLYKTVLKFGDQLHYSRTREANQSLIEFVVSEILRTYLQPSISSTVPPFCPLSDRGGAIMIVENNNSPQYENHPEQLEADTVPHTRENPSLSSSNAELVPRSSSESWRFSGLFCRFINSDNHWVAWGMSRLIQTLQWIKQLFLTIRQAVPLQIGSKKKREISEESELDLSDVD